MADDSARRAWLALIRVPGLGPARLSRLLETAGGPEAGLAAGSATWRAAGMSDRLQAGLRAPDWAGVDADERWLEAAGHEFIPCDDVRYPLRLRETPGAPSGLFTLGDTALLAVPQIAIVGARRATSQGRRDAAAFATGLVQGGFTATSGLAVGIDGAAHKGALEGGGSTVAVCANGLDRVYPSRHHELAHTIAERGLLVSEFPPGTTARPEYFPRRNRIISGLSMGVLVVEAARRSGSLITARLAAEQGREVFAIPGSIHNAMAAGCHALIRDGAALVESVADIFEALGLPPPEVVQAAAQHVAEANADQCSALERRVLDALGFAPVSLDDLMERVNAPPGALHEALLTLELAGHVAAVPGNRFSRLSGGSAGQ